MTHWNDLPDDVDVRRVLVVMAHPDDVDFLAAGAVALLNKRGAEVVYCVATDGSAGGTNTVATVEEVSVLRRDEQRAAAAAVGVQDVRFLNHLDGALTNNTVLRGQLVQAVRQVRPQLVITQSPEINWAFLPDAHADHRACGAAALQAVYPEARNPRAYPELLDQQQLAPWIVPRIWLVGSPIPNLFLDVTDHVEDKLAALRAHASQVDDQAAIETSIRQRLHRQAERGGLSRGRLAEEFQVVRSDW